ncbi:hypothetical protein PARPLA_02513 [Rhodobacteraceae bacterium THAF1]|uniref:hypothetical protein n=1 Tax=Palleronia sp. THAF1 TaxID=2587842 RepID=UPI000F3E8610|nr:hypothetical protein [Palleronia sp. THAF1]QFU07993.1 hypothetical protein FIU81_04840 [Palleronia sp. THAF1]VDC27844.1 hypothetical protein PARPLA_02513 [Rhodobacteraceae bacterium THAF1]
MPRRPLRLVIATALVLGSAATAQTVDPNAAARAVAQPPSPAAVAQALDGMRGQQFAQLRDSGLTVRGAQAQGDQLVLSLRDSKRASEYGPAAREGYAIVADRNIRAPLCADPVLSAFVARYGITTVITTRDNQPLANVAIDRC